MTASVKARIVGIWVVTGVLLALHATGIIDWSPWVIVAPVLFILTIIVVPLLIVVWIGIYRGLKIRIYNTFSHR
jgi:hypothetical protein